MRNQLIQVLRTYFSHWLAWGAVGLWLCILIQQFCCCKFSGTLEGMNGFLLVPTLLDAGLGVLIGIHLKSQFGNPRARLFPHFANAHLIVAAMLITILVLTEFLRAACCAEASLFSVPAIGLFFIVSFIWQYLAGSEGYLGAGLCLTNILMSNLLMCTVLFTPQWIVPWLHHAYGPFWFVAFGCGLVGLLIVGVKYANLSEEVPGYAMQISASIFDVTSRAGKRDRRQLEAQAVTRSKIGIRLRDFYFRLVCHFGKALTPWRRVWMRQMNQGFRGCLFSSVVLIFPLFFLWIQRNELFANAMPRVQTGVWCIFVMTVLGTPVFMGMSMCYGILLHQWPQLAHESLLPVHRTGFIRDLFHSVAFEIALFASMHCVGFSLGLWMLDVHSQYLPQLPWILLAMLALYLIVYGLILWSGSFQGMAVYLGVSMGFVVAGNLLVPLQFFWLEGLSWSPAIRVVELLAALLFAFGIYRLAWRRWLQLDLA